DLGAEERHARRERAGGDRAAEHHHRLRRGRKDGVHEHEHEDGVEAVVADRGGDRVGELGGDGGDRHGRERTQERRFFGGGATRRIVTGASSSAAPTSLTARIRTTYRADGTYRVPTLPVQMSVCAPAPRCTERAIAATTAPLRERSVAVTRAGRVSVNEAVRAPPRPTRTSAGETLSPPSVRFSENSRSAVVVCPWSSAAVAERRHWPSAAGDPSAFVPFQE